MDPNPEYGMEIKIRDPGSGMENPDPVSGIKITDPQHLLNQGWEKTYSQLLKYTVVHQLHISMRNQ
jgi:hypothetical protein